MAHPRAGRTVVADDLAAVSAAPGAAGGRFIYAGMADHVVHPRAQVARLWEHWGRPDIKWYRGGHAGFFQSRPVHRFVTAALVQSGHVLILGLASGRVPWINGAAARADFLRALTGFPASRLGNSPDPAHVFKSESRLR